MAEQLQTALSQILTTIDLPDQVTAEEANTYLERYLITPDAAEQIHVNLNEDGTVAQGSTVKPTNLKFNLGGVLLELLKGSVKLPGALASTPAALLLAIEFLQKMKQLATLDVGIQEANVLLAIYRLINEQDALTVDHLQEVVGADLSASQLMDSLDKLEQLGCISVAMNGITLNEMMTVELKPAGGAPA